MVYSERMPDAQELDALYNNYPVRTSLSTVTLARYDELLDGMEPYRQHGRLLDAGCGDGFFLDAAMKRGWKVFGTEYSILTVARLSRLGIAMEQGALDASHYPAAHFDVITSFEVIEHVTEPQAEVRTMVDLLRPGGLLYITTPNFNSLARRILGPRWNIITWPEHLNYYTSRSLADQVRACGARAQRITTTGISFARISAAIRKRSTNGPENDDRLRGCIEASRVLRGLKSLVNSLLDLLRAGDTLKAYFVKP